jgi:hypothetical protein
LGLNPNRNNPGIFQNLNIDDEDYACKIDREASDAQLQLGSTAIGPNAAHS